MKRVVILEDWNDLLKSRNQTVCILDATLDKFEWGV